MSEPGPCVICGDTNYPLSCGGPSICPKCDCGHFDAATVFKQAEVIKQLRAEIERLRHPPRPPVRPLTEGYVVKGGHNPGTSQIQTRPPAPAPIHRRMIYPFRRRK